ncbi:hypothetical protein Vadar_008927 [Vaccinium darrowii]|uniref:Uncharacterized protein n=1 Tax=Vaccinium darrowii TaxID=229202 RepID=A0ACB7XGA7_9ERIC|nr:hypothetical protein Vadar_008927 [Vaccinium darrowii]
MHPQGKGSIPLASTIGIPQPELKPLQVKGKLIPFSRPLIGPERINYESDARTKEKSKGFGSKLLVFWGEKSGDGPGRADEMDLTTDASILVQPDSGMNMRK